eukprot:GHVL01028701.1.p1 GENE.GHVL01028701.1~~GHVL01028701.1.p1  ORF type:complete len:182 (+),score=27.05 GHVL01028701.1:40-585(+)
MLKILIFSLVVSGMLGSCLVTLGCYEKAGKSEMCPKMPLPMRSIVQIKPIKDISYVAKSADVLYSYFKLSPYYDVIILMGCLSGAFEKIFVFLLLIKILYHLFTSIINKLIFIGKFSLILLSIVLIGGFVYTIFGGTSDELGRMLKETSSLIKEYMWKILRLLDNFGLSGLRKAVVAFLYQ